MAESSTEHKDLLVLQSLVTLAGKAATLPEMVLLLQQLIAVRPSHLRARHLLRSMEIILYDQTSRLGHSMTHLKAQTLLARAGANKVLEEKIVIIEEALASDPFNLKANLMLAQTAREMHLLPVAAFAYEMVVQENPEERAHQHELGLLYEHTKDWVEARSVYHEILQLDPDDLIAQEGMQRVLRELEQAQAPVAAPEAAAAEPELDEAQLAEISGRLQQLKTQLERYQRSAGQPIAQDQGKEREHTIAKLMTEKRTLNLKMARYKFNQAPQDVELQFQLAVACEESEVFGQALALFEQLKDIDSRRDTAMVHMGNCYIREALHQITRRRKEAADDPTTQAAPESFPGEYSRPEEANWF
jgi:tetratricopeptide (TPR) repeat protein